MLRSSENKIVLKNGENEYGGKCCYKTISFTNMSAKVYISLVIFETEIDA